MSATPKVSPALQALIDKGLFDRLPVTFSTFFFDRIQEWNLLFPAEKNYYERLFGLIDRSHSAAIEKLFAPLHEIEQKMGVTEKVWPKRQFTLDQVDFLNRSPYYPEWRRAIANIFSQLDPLLDAEIARSGHARLVVVISPSELPVGADRMWTRFRHQGRMISLDLSQDDDVKEHIPQLLTGGKRAERKQSIIQLFASSKASSPYDAWLIEAGDALSGFIAPSVTSAGAHGDGSRIVRLSYEQLRDYRMQLMNEVNKMLKVQEIRGPRQLGEKLKQLKITSAENEFARDPVLVEFVRATLLSGNGTLLINNTFVEWAAIQAARRARPSVAVVSFGIRNKVKPFSSLLIYTDQETASPIPTQMDTLGSYVDLEVFSYYLRLEFEKYAEYRRNTVFLFVGEGIDELLIIAPLDFFTLVKRNSAKLAEVFSWVKEWMSL
ncbi:MAG TPA: hypothetical protein VGQ81_06000 [Acidobacteriota bacterium]|nr:hypothetical protein [Acidobacteriota bacterium]